MANVHTVNHSKSENIKSHLSNEDGGMGVQKRERCLLPASFILCGGGGVVMVVVQHKVWQGRRENPSLGRFRGQEV